MSSYLSLIHKLIIYIIIYSSYDCLSGLTPKCMLAERVFKLWL